MTVGVLEFPGGRGLWGIRGNGNTGKGTSVYSHNCNKRVNTGLLTSIYWLLATVFSIKLTVYNINNKTYCVLRTKLEFHCALLSFNAV